jgi:hypothetical protein
MGAANGFVTVRPDARYGDQVGVFNFNEPIAQAFTVAGTITVSEIGIYGAAAGGSSACHFAIFTNGSGKPGSVVTGTDVTGSIPVSMGIAYAAVSNIQLTAGTYWIGCYVNSDPWNPSRFNGTGLGTVCGWGEGATYPTWGWGTWTSQSGTRDYSLYAVYTTAGGLSIPVAMNSYRQRRNRRGPVPPRDSWIRRNGIYIPKE